MTGKNSSGGVASYILEYNATGQLAKVTLGDVSKLYTTRNITYNSTGKISQISTIGSGVNPSTSKTDYTWNGDNIANDTGDASVTEYLSYDDKRNVFTSFKDINLVLFNRPTSKNIDTDIKLTYATVFSTVKYNFEYNTIDYATVRKSLNGGDLTKYYYAP